MVHANILSHYNSIASRLDKLSKPLHFLLKKNIFRLMGISYCKQKRANISISWEFWACFRSWLKFRLTLFFRCTNTLLFLTAIHWMFQNNATYFLLEIKSFNLRIVLRKHFKLVGIIIMAIQMIFDFGICCIKFTETLAEVS